MAISSRAGADRRTGGDLRGPGRRLAGPSLGGPALPHPSGHRPVRLRLAQLLGTVCRIGAWSPHPTRVPGTAGGRPRRAWWGEGGTAPRPTVGVHTHDEVVAHGPRLAQLVGVAVVHHVVAAGGRAVTPGAGEGWGRVARGRRGARPGSSVPSLESLPRSHRQELLPRVWLGRSFRRGGGRAAPHSAGPQGQRRRASGCAQGPGLRVPRAGEQKEQPCPPAPRTARPSGPSPARKVPRVVPLSCRIQGWAKPAAALRQVETLWTNRREAQPAPEGSAGCSHGAPRASPSPGLQVYPPSQAWFEWPLGLKATDSSPWGWAPSAGIQTALRPELRPQARSAPPGLTPAPPSE